MSRTLLPRSGLRAAFALRPPDGIGVADVVAVAAMFVLIVPRADELNSGFLCKSTGVIWVGICEG